MSHDLNCGDAPYIPGMLRPRRTQSWHYPDKRPKAPRFCEEMPRCTPCFLPHRPMGKRRIRPSRPETLTPAQMTQAAVVMGIAQEQP